MYVPYQQEKLMSAHHIARTNDKPGIIAYERMNKEYYKVSKKSVPIYSFSEFTTPLSAVGACILSHSKIVLLDNIHFLLSHLDPSKAELLYLGKHFYLKSTITILCLF